MEALPHLRQYALVALAGCAIVGRRQLTVSRENRKVLVCSPSWQNLNSVNRRLPARTRSLGSADIVTLGLNPAQGEPGSSKVAT